MQIPKFARPRGSGAGVIALFCLTVVVAGCVTPGDPSEPSLTRLEAVTSISLEGTVGTLVDPAPAVRAMLPDGTPVRGVPVHFRIVSGTGALSETVVETSADGVATAAWTLGTVPEVSVVHASSPGVAAVAFTAASLAGPAASLTVLSPGRLGIAGARSGVLPSVAVRDAYSNPVSNVTVVFAVTTGGGSIAGSTAFTDFKGVATAGHWTLGLPGDNTATATVEGLEAVHLTVTAVPIAGIFELDSIRIGSMKGVGPPSRIVLGEKSQFLIEVGNVVGSGDYEMTNSRVILRYSDDFLSRLFDAHAYSNMPWMEGGEDKETGNVYDFSIILYRCWTEDCYDSSWTYSKRG